MSLVGRILGDKDLDQLLNRIDNIITNFPIVTTKESIPSTYDTLQEYVSSIRGEEFQAILNNISVPKERLNRYNVYDELYSSVQLIKRIFKIYRDNILQKNLVSGDILLYKQKDSSRVTDSEYKRIEEYTRSVVKRFDIVKRLKNNLVIRLLKYGDYFVEIIDLKSPKITVPKVTNTAYLNSLTYNIQEIDSSKAVDAFTDLVFEIESIDDQLLMESDDNEERDILSIISDIDLNRIFLKFHKPHNVIIINSPNDETNILGYLIIEDKNITEERLLSPALRFAQVFLRQYSNGSEKLDRLVSEILKKVSEKIIKSAGITYTIDPSLSREENEKIYQQELFNKLSSDVFYTLKSVLLDLKDQNTLHGRRVRVRLVPTSRMVHFTIPSPEYYPYGLSIVDPLVLPGKLYLLHSLSNIIMKLSRAAPIRKWVIETGPRGISSNLLERFKRELRNRRISVDDVLSFKSLPRILSDFQDAIILTKKGQRFIDLEVQSLEDVSSKVTDLEDARNELISLSGVPAAYLGFGDIVELRDYLVNVNIAFANDILSIQESICSGIAELIDKVTYVYHGKRDIQISDYVEIYLTPPVLLMLQILEAVMGSVSNILAQTQSIRGVTIDPITLLKQFVPYLDWDYLIEKGREAEVKLQGQEAGPT